MAAEAEDGLHGLNVHHRLLTTVGLSFVESQVMEVYHEMLRTGCERSVITYDAHPANNAWVLICVVTGDGSVPGDAAHRLRAQRDHVQRAHQRL
jgi:hypothetical protein